MEDFFGIGIFVVFNGMIVGVVGILDFLKWEVFFVVEGLQCMGIWCIMVIGDNWGIAKLVVYEVGIDEVFVEVFLGGKVKIIKKLQVDGIVIVMVGDGVNDFSVLVVLDVGIVIGVGIDIVIEVVDYVLMRNSLEDVIIVIDLSRKTFARIKMNYIFVMGYNVFVIFVVVGVFFLWLGVSLLFWVVGVVMVFFFVFVVCFLFLLRRYIRFWFIELVQVKVQ